LFMRVISKKILVEFYGKQGFKDAKGPLEAWYHEAKKANWKSWTDIKKKYRSASPLKDSRVVFNIGGNKYRLVVKINYPAQIVFIRFIGTHKEYDSIDAEVI